MVLGKRNDPYLGFNFLVEIDSVVIGGFSDVTGLQAQIQSHDYQEGGVNEYGRKFADRKMLPGDGTEDKWLAWRLMMLAAKLLS